MTTTAPTHHIANIDDMAQCFVAGCNLVKEGGLLAEWRFSSVSESDGALPKLLKHFS